MYRFLLYNFITHERKIDTMGSFDSMKNNGNKMHSGILLGGITTYKPNDKNDTMIFLRSNQTAFQRARDGFALYDDFTSFR